MFASFGGWEAQGNITCVHPEDLTLVPAHKSGGQQPPMSLLQGLQSPLWPLQSSSYMAHIQTDLRFFFFNPVFQADVRPELSEGTDVTQPHPVSCGSFQATLVDGHTSLLCC